MRLFSIVFELNLVEFSIELNTRILLEYGEILTVFAY